MQVRKLAEELQARAERKEEQAIRLNLKHETRAYWRGYRAAMVALLTRIDDAACREFEDAKK